MIFHDEYKNKLSRLQYNPSPKLFIPVYLQPCKPRL